MGERDNIDPYLIKACQFHPLRSRICILGAKGFTNLNENALRSYPLKRDRPDGWRAWV
jgi:hypothetical protein